MFQDINLETRQVKALCIRVLLPLVLLISIFFYHWKQIPHTDFQVWQTALEMANDGQNPYNAEQLNQTLREVSERDGGIFSESNYDLYFMQFFNPPWWLLQVKLLGTSAMVMNLIGMVLTSFSLAWLGRSLRDLDYLIAIVAPLYFVHEGLGYTTFALGQTGFWLAGFFGLYLVLIKTKWSGVPLMALAFKPHIALAAGLGEFLALPKERLKHWLPVIAICIGATMVVFQPTLWIEYIEANLRSDLPAGADDFTLRTVSPRFLLPNWTNLIGIATAFAIAIATSYKWRTARPELLVLWTTALTIFLSGHGFDHDWMWLIFIPVICKWRGHYTLATFVTAAVVHTYEFDRRDQLVSLLTLMALAATIYLGFEAYKSAKRSDTTTTKADQTSLTDTHF